MILLCEILSSFNSKGCYMKDNLIKLVIGHKESKELIIKRIKIGEKLFVNKITSLEELKIEKNK